MAKKFLDCPYIVSVFKQVSCKKMTKGVTACVFITEVDVKIWVNSCDFWEKLIFRYREILLKTQLKQYTIYLLENNMAEVPVKDKIEYTVALVRDFSFTVEQALCAVYNSELYQKLCDPKTGLYFKVPLMCTTI